MGNKATVKALRKDLKNDIIDSAAKIAMKKASAAEETRKLQAKANDPTRKQKNIQDYTTPLPTLPPRNVRAGISKCSIQQTICHCRR